MLHALLNLTGLSNSNKLQKAGRSQASMLRVAQLSVQSSPSPIKPFNKTDTVRFQGTKNKQWEDFSFLERVSHNFKKAKIQPIILTSLFGIAVSIGMIIVATPLGLVAATICLPISLAIVLEPIIKAALKIKKE